MTGLMERVVTGEPRRLRPRWRQSVTLATTLLALASLAATVTHWPLQASRPWHSNLGVGAPMLSAPPRADASPRRPVTQVMRLSCEKLADVPGKSVTTALVSFPPRAYSPAHRHPGSVTAFVVSGSIRSEVAGTPARVYAAGSTWFEPAGALHVFAENPSDVHEAQLLAVFVTDDDCGPLVLPEPSRGPVASSIEEGSTFMRSLLSQTSAVERLGYISTQTSARCRDVEET